MRWVLIKVYEEVLAAVEVEALVLVALIAAKEVGAVSSVRVQVVPGLKVIKASTQNPSNFLIYHGLRFYLE